MSEPIDIDNRDPETTEIHMTIEVNPWELVENAIQNLDGALDQTIIDQFLEQLRDLQRRIYKTLEEA